MGGEHKCFDILVVFDDDTIRRMFRAEYYTYETARRLLRFLLGAAGIMAALFADFPTAGKTVCLMAGVWMLVAGDFPSKVQAEGVISQRRGRHSQVVCRVKDEGLEVQGGGFLSYSSLDRLVYDEEYLYLFASRQTAVMLPAAAIGAERLESFKAEVREKSGKQWKRLTTGFLEYNLRDLVEALAGRQKTSTRK